MTASLPFPIKIARNFSWFQHFRGGGALLRRAVPDYRGRRVVVNNRGVRISCDLDSLLEWQIAVLRDYEGDRKRLFVSLFPADRRQLMIDVGANIGGHALYFGRYFQHVLAIEPGPAIFARLAENIGLNPQLNITPFQLGLGDREETLRFYQPPAGHTKQGMGTFDRSYAVDNTDVLELPVLPGDLLLEGKGLGRVDGIKMDIQGLEPHALKGFAKTLTTDRPAVWFEMSTATIPAMEEMGGLEKLIPPNYGLYRFTSARIFGIVHRTFLEPISDWGSNLPGDYAAVPMEWAEGRRS